VTFEIVLFFLLQVRQKLRTEEKLLANDKRLKVNRLSFFSVSHIVRIYEIETLIILARRTRESDNLLQYIGLSGIAGIILRQGTTLASYSSVLERLRPDGTGFSIRASCTEPATSNDFLLCETSFQTFLKTLLSKRSLSKGHWT